MNQPIDDTKAIFHTILVPIATDATDAPTTITTTTTTTRKVNNNKTRVK